MRRIPAVFMLVVLAVISIGCSSSDQGSAPNANAPGTTTYNTSNAPMTAATPPHTDGASGVSNTNSSSSGGAAPKTSPNKPGIKPPTE